MTYYIQARTQQIFKFCLGVNAVALVLCTAGFVLNSYQFSACTSVTCCSSMFHCSRQGCTLANVCEFHGVKLYFKVRQRSFTRPIHGKVQRKRRAL